MGVKGVISIRREQEKLSLMDWKEVVLDEFKFHIVSWSKNSSLISSKG
jgi:hypothetical protein